MADPPRSEVVAPRPALARALADDAPALVVAGRFRAAGHELYLVGGKVRDAFLDVDDRGRDFDFATDATPEETLALLKPLATNVWTQGAKFGTIGAEVDGVRMEITTFRTERYEPDSRHPEVDFAATIETDLSRRDFTINAMAIRLPEKEALDPHGGLDDLKRRVLRTPGAPDDSFGDDPLRMLRAFRFASQLDFMIAPDVLTSIEVMKDKLRTVSAERIRDELSRLLVGLAPARALELAHQSGITELFLPELSSLRLAQDPVHRHKDVFHHTLAVLERTPKELVLRLAALLHDVGKPKTREIGDDGVSFHHHEVVGARMARERLRALRYPNEIVVTVHDLIYLHHRFHTYRLGWTDSAVRRYVRDAGPLLGLLNSLVRADCTTRNARKAKELAARMDELEERIAELAEKEALDRIRPELDGVQIMAYLGVPPGPIVGEASEFLLGVRLEEGELGDDEVYRRLDGWAREKGHAPVGKRVPPRERKAPDPA